MKVIEEAITSNVMYREDTGVKDVKRFYPKTIKELIEYAKTNELEGLPESSIDVNILKLQEKENQTDLFDKKLDIIPSKYSVLDGIIQWKIFKLSMTHTEEGVIYLPGHYKVLLVDENNSKTEKTVDQLQGGESVLCKILDNAVISQSLHHIEKVGDYKIENIVELEIPEEVYLPIGSGMIRIFVKE